MSLVAKLAIDKEQITKSTLKNTEWQDALRDFL